MRSLGTIAVLLVVMMTGCAKTGREFFAFDNGLRGIEGTKEKVAVLKELGYAGITESLGDLILSCEKTDLRNLWIASCQILASIIMHG